MNSPTILGILGGIFGILGGLFAIFVGGLGYLFSATDSIFIINIVGGIGAILISIIGIVVACMSDKKPMKAGGAMILCGILGLVFITFGYIVAGPLFIIGGWIALPEDMDLL